MWYGCGTVRVACVKVVISYGDSVCRMSGSSNKLWGFDEDAALGSGLKRSCCEEMEREGGFRREERNKKGSIGIGAQAKHARAAREKARGKLFGFQEFPAAHSHLKRSQPNAEGQAGIFARPPINCKDPHHSGGRSALRT